MRVSRESKLWVKGGTLRRARYAEIAKAKRNELGPLYLELADQRRATAGSLRLLLVAVQICFFAAFALTLIPIGANGHSFWTATRDLREILVVISAIVGVAIGFVSHHHEVLTEIVSAEVAARSNGDQVLKEILDITYGLTIFPLSPPVQGDLELGSSHGTLVRVCTILAWLSAAFVAVGSILIRLKVLEGIYFDPTFSVEISCWVIGFAVITDMLGLFFIVLSAGPLRARRRERQLATG